jgi:hypothetical protein
MFYHEMVFGLFPLTVPQGAVIYNVSASYGSKKKR